MQRSAFKRRTLLCILLAASLAVCGCRTLPPRPEVPVVGALPPATLGALAEVSARFARSAPDAHSGFLLIPANRDAMTWRLALIDHATASIDAQYFIWGSDEAATLLFDRVLKAADRGVRVRVLVDDSFLDASDRDIAALCLHPNLDIRIFNPGNVRGSAFQWRLGFLSDFKELNRRLHNKLFIVDGHLAVIGGRNIGNAYFGLSQKYNFRDLDVLVVGPVVEEASGAFDEYWNADMAYPGGAMSDKATLEDLEAIRGETTLYLGEHRDVLASYPPELLDWGTDLLQLPDRMVTGEAHFLQDEPVRVGEEELRLVDMLERLAEPSHEELIIASPYLIPDAPFLKDLEELSVEGVDVKILTSSLGSNNQTPAHSHYKKYRRRILAAGGDLHEFKHDPSALARALADVPPVQADRLCLHVKALVGDRKRCFIGSLNLDPRAVEINTENGLYIESAGLSRQLAEHLDALMSPENAWRVTVDERNKLRWESSTGTLTKQPALDFSQRVDDFIYRLLPIEGQL